MAKKKTGKGTDQTPPTSVPELAQGATAPFEGPGRGFMPTADEWIQIRQLAQLIEDTKTGRHRGIETITMVLLKAW